MIAAMDDMPQLLLKVDLNNKFRLRAIKQLRTAPILNVIVNHRYIRNSEHHLYELIKMNSHNFESLTQLKMEPVSSLTNNEFLQLELIKPHLMEPNF